MVAPNLAACIGKQDCRIVCVRRMLAAEGAVVGLLVHMACLAPTHHAHKLGPVRPEQAVLLPLVLERLPVRE
jgi:hypothetical protein